MTLTEAKEGDWLVVTGVAGEEIMLAALRFGIDEGARIRLEKKIPAGPVIISRNQLEIALGRRLAQAIEVAPAAGEDGRL